LFEGFIVSPTLIIHYLDCFFLSKQRYAFIFIFFISFVSDYYSTLLSQNNSSQLTHFLQSIIQQYFSGQGGRMKFYCIEKTRIQNILGFHQNKFFQISKFQQKLLE